jgi:uncharacterized protein (TIGR00725 family)
MRISIFGGSQPLPGSQAYSDAEALGKGLADLGHTVITGGYTGTMEAVSRGAAGAGGHVIGVTCGEIEQSHRRALNAWVSEEWRNETLVERLQKLILGCDAALALPGGPGTLTEIALTWNLMIVGGAVRRPLILIGEGWQAMWDAFYRNLGQYVAPAHRALLSFAEDSAAGLELLQAMLRTD